MIRSMRRLAATFALAWIFALIAACGGSGLDRVNHVVIVYLENHSFDNLYGSFSGASGLAAATGAPLQQDLSGTAYATLPPPSDTRFPPGLPNAPFDIAPYVP